MEIGISLPMMVPGCPGRTLLEWATGAEEFGFSTVAATDRVVYDSYEPITVLAGAAAVTRRVRLATTLVVSPLRTNTALFAKQAATVDRISDGRLVLGVAAGIRPDDFEVSGASYGDRGKFLDQQVEELRRIWSTDGIGPAPTRPGGPALIFGGHSDAAIRRAARFGDGWIAGVVGPVAYAADAERVEAAWEKEGRSERPRKLAVGYFAFGDDAAATAARYINDYYAFAPDFAAFVVSNAAIGADGLLGMVDAFEQAGCDELILAPCAAEPAQLELAADTLKDRLPSRG